MWRSFIITSLLGVGLSACGGACPSCDSKHKAEQKRAPVTRKMPDDTVGSALKKETPRHKLSMPVEGWTPPPKAVEDD